VIKLLASNGEGLSKNAIEAALAEEHTQKSVRTAIVRSVENQLVVVLGLFATTAVSSTSPTAVGWSSSV
jgi:hypothetical protein